MNNLPLKPRQREQLDLLKKLVQDNLSEECEKSDRKIFFFIKRTLFQFRLNSQEENDILIDAYIRVREQIKSGTFIENMLVYLNRVCFNIIREHSRKQKRSSDLPNLLIDNGHKYLEAPFKIDTSNADKITILIEALGQLKKEDSKIIRLRIVRGLSWKEIQEELYRDQQKKISVNTLRKQGERALKRLRKVYFSH